MLLTEYASWLGLSVEDARVEAEDSGMVIRGGVLSGRDEQSGVTVEDLSALSSAGMEPPVLLDSSTGWVVSHSAGGGMGVMRDAFDRDVSGAPVWFRCHPDGVVDDGEVGLPLSSALGG